MQSETARTLVESLSDEAANFPSDYWWASRISSKSRFFPELVSYLEGKPFQPQFKKYFLNFIRQTVHAIRLSGQCLQAAWLFKSAKNNLRSLPNAKIQICKSFAYKANFAADGTFTDPYLKDLLPHLPGEQIVHLVDPQMPLKFIPKNSKQILIPYQLLISPWDVVKSYILLNCEFLRLSFFPREKERQSKILSFYRWELISPSTLNNYLFLKMASRLKTWGLTAHTSFYTYENNSWERMFILGHRRQWPSCQIFGIQHSVIPEASLNMFIGKTEAALCPQPDTILTSGPLAQEMLLNGSSTQARLSIFGTTRYQYLRELKPTTHAPTYDLLIALEGVPIAEEMIRRVLEQMDSLGSYKILLRPHPAFPLSKIAKDLDQDPRGYPNISVSSEASVLGDIRNSKIVLYLGSACAFEAIKIGRPLIAFKLQALLDYDPLKDLQYFKRNWQPQASLKSIIDDLLSMTVAQTNEEQAKAAIYVDSFFSKIPEKTIFENPLN
jgi:hypothetical protein